MKVAIVDTVELFGPASQRHWATSGVCFGGDFSCKGCELYTLVSQSICIMFRKIILETLKGTPLPITIDTNDYPELFI